MTDWAQILVELGLIEEEMKTFLDQPSAFDLERQGRLMTESIYEDHDKGYTLD